MRVNRAWLGLVVLMLPTLLVAMDMTALLLALPRLSADLGATNVQQLWISDSSQLLLLGPAHALHAGLDDAQPRAVAPGVRVNSTSSEFPSSAGAPCGCDHR